jgi:hypothetical protein
MVSTSTVMIGVTTLHQLTNANGSAPAASRLRATGCDLPMAMNATQITTPPTMPRLPVAVGRASAPRRTLWPPSTTVKPPSQRCWSTASTSSVRVLAARIRMRETSSRTPGANDSRRSW